MRTQSPLPLPFIPAGFRYVVFAIALLVCCRFSAAGSDGFIQRHNFQLHYEIEGSGQPLVFLGGGPGMDVIYLKPIAEMLPAGFQRVFLHQRGTGRSRFDSISATNMTIELMIEDLELLRKELLQEKLLLLGHSWGGMLAMAYAAAHPERVDRLILIGSGGPTLHFHEWFGDNIAARLRPEDLELQRYWREAGQHGVDADKAATESLRAIAPGYFFDRAAALKFAAQLPDGLSNPKVAPAVYANLGNSYDLSAGLRKLQAPVLIVHGHQDPIGDKTAEGIHSLIRSSTLRYIRRCGHMPWIEQPEEFQRIITVFLEASRPKE